MHPQRSSPPLAAKPDNIQQEPYLPRLLHRATVSPLRSKRTNLRLDKSRWHQGEAMFYSSAQSCRIHSNQIQPPVFEGPGLRCDTYRDDWISQGNERKKSHAEGYGLPEHLRSVLKSFCCCRFFWGGETKKQDVPAMPRWFESTADFFFFFALSSGCHHFTQAAFPAVTLDKSLLTLRVTLASLRFCLRLPPPCRFGGVWVVGGGSLVCSFLISCRYRDSNYFLLRHTTKVYVFLAKKTEPLSWSWTML